MQIVAVAKKFTLTGSDVPSVYENNETLAADLRGQGLDVYMIATYVVTGNVEWQSGPFIGPKGKVAAVFITDPLQRYAFWLITKDFLVAAVESGGLDIPGLEDKAAVGTQQSALSMVKAMADMKITAFKEALGGNSAPDLGEFFFQDTDHWGASGEEDEEEEEEGY